MEKIKQKPSLFGFIVSTLLFIFAFFAKFVIGSDNFYQEFGFFPNQIVLIAALCFMITLLSGPSSRSIFLTSIRDLSFLNPFSSLDKFWPIRKRVLTLFFFVMISFITFRLNSDRLLVGIDGETMITNLNSSKKFSESYFYFSNNPIQGLGTTPFYQANFTIDPGYMLLRIDPLQMGIPIAYTFWTLLLLLSCMTMCYVIKLNFQSAFAASSIAVSFLVYPHGFFFNAVTFLVPHVITTMSITTLVASLLLLDWKKLLPWQIYGRRIALTLLLLFSSLHNPNYLLLQVPLIASFVAEWVAGFKTIRRPSLKFFDLTSLLFSTFFMVLAISFSVSLILYSAAFFHGGELLNTYTISWNTLSVIFSRRHAVGIIVILAFTLIIIDYLNSKGERSHPYFKIIRVTAIFALIQTLMSSLALVLAKSWRGPLPFYFEFPIYPIYAILVALFIIRGAKSVLANFGSSSSPMNPVIKKFDHRSVAVLLVLLYLISFNIQSSNNSRIKSKGLDSEMAQFINENRINEQSVFVGRFESFLSQKNDSQLNFREYSEEVIRNNQKLFGSSFRFGDIWKLNVPTLVEYHANFSPRSYEITKTLLSSRKSSFARTGNFFTNLKIERAEILGVSKVVTNSPKEGLVPTLIVGSGDSKLYFYKLKSPNLGQISPVNVVVINSLNEMKRKIQVTGDLNTTVFVERYSGDKDLIPASASSLKLIRGGYRIVAHAQGKSAILLPIEYSSCYKFEPLKYDQTLDIMDANIGMTLVVFERTANFEIKYRHGPLTNPLCKFRDFARYRSFVNSPMVR